MTYYPEASSASIRPIEQIQQDVEAYRKGKTLEKGQLEQLRGELERHPNRQVAGELQEDVQQLINQAAQE